MHIVTYVDARRSSINEALSLLQGYRNATVNESGNLETLLLRETNRPNRFVIVEAWRDEPTFQAHERAPHTAEFRSKLATIHNSPNDQRVHQAFSVGATRHDPGLMYVVTHVDVPPPRREETELLLRSLAERSRNDDGNVRYDVFQQTSRTIISRYSRSGRTTGRSPLMMRSSILVNSARHLVPCLVRHTTNGCTTCLKGSDRPPQAR